MKKITLLFLILIFGNLAYAQEKLTRTEKLTATSKVWGFLKYNHPKIAEGTYNWDFELFRFLPEFLAAKDIRSRERLMLDWINSLGEISQYKRAKRKSKNTFSTQVYVGMTQTIWSRKISLDLGLLIIDEAHEGIDTGRTDRE